MASDLDLLIGKWTVKVKSWTWEYEFSPGGKLTWRDVNSLEKGTGSWAASPKLVNISWVGSGTSDARVFPHARPRRHQRPQHGRRVPQRQHAGAGSGLHPRSSTPEKFRRQRSGDASTPDAVRVNTNAMHRLWAKWRSEKYERHSEHDIAFKIPLDLAFVLF